MHSAIRNGFIEPANERLVLFVDGPPNLLPDATAIPEENPEWIKAHEEFDWGTAALEALDGWDREVEFKKYPFDWGRRRNASAGADVDQDGGLAGA
jgi:hypothetical protein